MDMDISVIQDTAYKQDQFISELMPGNAYSHHNNIMVARQGLIERLRYIRERGKIAIDCDPLPIGIDVVMQLYNDSGQQFAKSNTGGFLFKLPNKRFLGLIKSSSESENGEWYLWIETFERNGIKDKQRYHIIGKVSHVHQLQNLFFAITGENLSLIE